MPSHVLCFPRRENPYKKKDLITILLGEILDCSNIPADWIHANVTPIYKKGAKNLAENYRSISLTSLVCKLIDSLIRKFTWATLKGIQSNVLLFADDAKILNQFLSREDALTVQSDLNSLEDWFIIWLLNFNCDKCQVFGKQENIRYTHRYSTKVN